MEAGPGACRASCGAGALGTQPPLSQLPWQACGWQVFRKLLGLKGRVGMREETFEKP